MREPAFWWRPPGTAAALLAPLAAIYGGIAAGRLNGRGYRASVPVICVGNPTLGGAGKTPTALAIVKLLQASGERPVFVSRGYGGSLKGPVRVNPDRHSAAEVGDEPLLLARAAPTMVARDRAAGARAAEVADASVIVMDDGFQNPSLVKDLSLLVIDARRGLGNRRVFPAGPLRAPLAPQLARGRAIVLIGDAPPPDDLVQAGLPVLRARLAPDARVVAALAGAKVLAFAGIGDPDKFFATLVGAGLHVADRVGFADHHVYTADEANDLLARARHRSLVLVTTEKDAARLDGGADRPRPLAELGQRAHGLPVELVFDEPDALRRLLAAALDQARARIKASASR